LSASRPATLTLENETLVPIEKDAGWLQVSHGGNYRKYLILN